MVETDRRKIEAGLRRIRGLRMTMLVIALAFIPLVLFISRLGLSQPLFMGIGLAWIGLGVIIEIVIGFSRCPACGKPFHVCGMSGNLLSRQCLNCGIPLKSTSLADGCRSSAPMQ